MCSVHPLPRAWAVRRKHRSDPRSPRAAWLWLQQGWLWRHPPRPTQAKSPCCRHFMLLCIKTHSLVSAHFSQTFPALYIRATDTTKSEKQAEVLEEVLRNMWWVGRFYGGSAGMTASGFQKFYEGHWRVSVLRDLHVSTHLVLIKTMWRGPCYCPHLTQRSNNLCKHALTASGLEPRLPCS